MTTRTDQQPESQYYIDWLRNLLIVSVYIFPIGMIFNNWPLQKMTINMTEADRSSLEMKHKAF